MAAWQRRLRSRLGCVAESGNRLNLRRAAPLTPIRRTVNLSHSKAGGSRAHVLAFRKSPIRTGIRRPIMTLHGLLMWCLGVGAVAFIGVAGASGYQLLARQHAQSVAQRAPETSATPSANPSPAVTTPSSAIAAAEPTPTAPAVNPAAGSPSPAAPGSAAASLPLLRRHVASAAAAPDHAVRTGKHPVRRSAAATVAAHHPAPRPPSLAAATPLPHVPSYRSDGYATPRQPGVWYPPPPAPPAAYYPYQGYYGYRSGYAYYAGYPRYPYYPAY